MSKPCLNCLEHLLKAGILKKNIYYTNENGTWQNLIKK